MAQAIHRCCTRKKRKKGRHRLWREHGEHYQTTWSPDRRKGSLMQLIGAKLYVSRRIVVSVHGEAHPGEVEREAR